jgi:DNA-binding beta-propeller fold protein YncE
MALIRLPREKHMASRRGMVTLVAGALIVVACTNNLANPAPAPTAPPDAFASTPTIAGIPSTTLTPPTTIPDERVVLQRVDPVSLQPVAAFEPIPMGDGLCCGAVSPDGGYFIAQIWHDGGATGDELRLVDTTSWAQVATWSGAPTSAMRLTDEGSLYYLSHGARLQLHTQSLSEPTARVVADLPPEFNSWYEDELLDGQFVSFGTRPNASTGEEDALIVTIDIASGSVTEIPLPEVTVGQVDPVSQGPWASYLYTSPSVTWDSAGSRAFVVHGDEDIVSEVDVRTGQIVQHPVAGTAEIGSGTRRSSALSPDGNRLYVATRTVELIEDDDDWMVVTRPAGVQAVDTTSWDMVLRTDEPVSDIWVSPSGEGIIAAGYSTEESETVYLEESTGLYLLDAGDLSVRVHYPPEREDQFWGPVTFTEAGSIAYVSTWLGFPSVHALELASGEILSTAESTETLEMIGPVGVLASNR